MLLLKFHEKSCALYFREDAPGLVEGLDDVSMSCVALSL